MDRRIPSKKVNAIDPTRNSQSIFRTEMWLGSSVEKVFGFFSDARNLQELTPPWLQFKIITAEPIVIRPGALIDYRLRLHGWPIRWQTEITEWEPPFRFVDEQRRGPYKLWIHEHRFEAVDGGTLASDLVRYAVPGGKLVDRLFVRKDVERIFEYRSKRLVERFGARER